MKTMNNLLNSAQWQRIRRPLRPSNPWLIGLLWTSMMIGLTPGITLIFTGKNLD